MNKKVSLVVPMYLCEEFVDPLMDQLLGQDYNNIEIICVVDGSTDRTEELIRKRAGEDDRIRVIKQEHLGAGVSLILSTLYFDCCLCRFLSPMSPVMINAITEINGHKALSSLLSQYFLFTIIVFSMHSFKDS